MTEPTIVMDSYWTIGEKYGPVEVKERSSRFISLLFPVPDQNHADGIIKGLKRKYHDSTHVCYAYCLGQGREEYSRYNDDGEPSGTAGQPILNEIRSKKVFNILVVVVRYFGGIKLGTGGLARAYSKAAKLVLDCSVKRIVQIKRKMTLDLPFEFIGDVMSIVKRFNLDIVHQNYTGKGVHLQIDVPVKIISEIENIICERSKGKLKPITTD